jgi:hypothetical protein
MLQVVEGHRSSRTGAPRERNLGVAVDNLGDPEIEHLDDARVQHEDVVRFQVTMDDVEPVRDVERTDDGHGVLDDLRGRQQPPSLQQLAERHSLEVLEHHERVPVVLADVMNDDDVLVRGPRRGASLPKEALDIFRLQLAMEELNRNLAAQLRISRGEHSTKSAAPELADDLVLSDSRSWPGEPRGI